MRIISGSHKSKRIWAPKKLPVRPTTDMAKEALFNILDNTYHLEEITVLDLFSGTGNISYEFASRGVKEITSVDKNSGCIQFIDKTSKELQFPISVIKSDVFKFLKHTKLKVDIVFADPPYNFEIKAFNEIYELVFINGLLNEDGILVIEHAEQTDLSPLPHFYEKRKYGGNVFSFFKT